MTNDKNEKREIAAAREMCRLFAEECNVDLEDAWKIHGYQFRKDTVCILAAVDRASPSPEEEEAAITPDCETCARAAFEGRYRRDSLDPAVADDFGLFLSGYIAGRASQPEAAGTAGGDAQPGGSDA